MKIPTEIFILLDIDVISPIQPPWDFQFFKMFNFDKQKVGVIPVGLIYILVYVGFTKYEL